MGKLNHHLYFGNHTQFLSCDPKFCLPSLLYLVVEGRNIWMKWFSGIIHPKKSNLSQFSKLTQIC